jgi:hypothetical protein
VVVDSSVPKAGFVGYGRDFVDTTFLAEILKLPERQRLWIVPYLIGIGHAYGSSVIAQAGVLASAEFVKSETRKVLIMLHVYSPPLARMDTYSLTDRHVGEFPPTVFEHA